MGFTAALAAIFVIVTLVWIGIDAVKSHRRDKARTVQHDTGRLIHSERMKQLGVAELEIKVEKSMKEIARLTPAPAAPHNPEVTPSGEISAVNPLDEETRCMRAVREKSGEVERIVQRKAKA